MSKKLNVSLAQINPIVGDVKGNTQKILNVITDLTQQQLDSDLVIFPELCITGYPPEDLLLRPELTDRVEIALQQIISALPPRMHVVVGHPCRDQGQLYNSASILNQDGIMATYHKQCLPNYLVFDEMRYFVAGDKNCIVTINQVRVALLICEDLWQFLPTMQLHHADVIVSLNASPYHAHQLDERRAVAKARVEQSGLPLIYVNQVGGQDELVFDGRSFIMDESGQIVHQLALFDTEVSSCTLQFLPFAVSGVATPTAEPEKDAEIYQALVTGVRDYVTKNGFPGAVLGLSGGIDSALTLAIAVDALGADRVQAVMMPFLYTAEMSVSDAAQQAEMLGVEFNSVSIESMYHAFMQQLQPLFGERDKDTTEENLQSRCRGLLLMALSNKTGKIVLTTGNKSEMAVGYATLYGDMAGGFDVLKDVPKTLVYRLSDYRNSVSAAIPQRVIDRPPSAELAPDQVDQDSLPPYDVLDAILEMYIEQDRSISDIVAAGFEQEIVAKVARLVDINEHKRRQAAPGVRISKRAFGRDRRYPITSGFRWY